MMSETLQALRAEIEAVTTLQLALNRLALSVDENALTVWEGPRPEDVEGLADDDGSLSRGVVLDLRNRAADALAKRFKEVEQVVMGRAALESLLREALHTGSGGVITGEGPPTEVMLRALARSGALRLDWAQTAVAHVREELEARRVPPPKPSAPKAPPRAPAAKRKPAPTPKAPKKPAKKAPPKKPAKKAAGKKKPGAKRKAATKKPAAKKAARGARR